MRDRKNEVTVRVIVAAGTFEKFRFDRRRRNLSESSPHRRKISGLPHDFDTALTYILGRIVADVFVPAPTLPSSSAHRTGTPGDRHATVPC